MTDDLVAQLREYGSCGMVFEAADHIEKLEAALVEIFDHECRTSSKSFIACVARDALWPQALEGKDA